MARLDTLFIWYMASINSEAVSQVVDYLQDLVLAEGEVGLEQVESTKNIRVPLKV